MTGFKTIDSEILGDDQLQLARSVGFDAILMQIRTRGGRECMYLNRTEAEALRQYLDDWLLQGELDEWVDELEEKWLAERGVY